MGRWPLIQLTAESILFVDDHVVAVDKAPGVLCDASIDPNRDHLGVALGRWALDTLPGGASAAAEFLPAHRLDLGTSGVVLFARNRAAATALMQQFQDRTVTKEYQAVVRSSAELGWQVGDSIDRRSYLRHRKGRSEEVRSGGKPAQTRFEVTQIDGSVALVRAFPKTGRTHQLRVQLAALGAPIVGDDLYGRAETTRLWLHADTLTLAHPISGEPLVLRSRNALAVVDGKPVEHVRVG